MEVLTAPLTYQAFKEMEFSEEELNNYLFELLNGEIMHKNYPSLTHQRTLRNLVLGLEKHLASQHPKSGELLFAPFGVILDEFNAPQPDLIFVSAANQAIIQEEGIFGVPDLLIEIISPSSLKMDRFTKAEIYEKAGVTEYWLVDTNNESVEIYENVNNRFKIFSVIAVSGSLSSKIFPELKMEISEVFS